MAFEPQWRGAISFKVRRRNHSAAEAPPQLEIDCFHCLLEDNIVTLSNENGPFLRIIFILSLRMMMNTGPEKNSKHTSSTQVCNGWQEIYSPPPQKNTPHWHYY